MHLGEIFKYTETTRNMKEYVKCPMYSAFCKIS